MRGDKRDVKRKGRNKDRREKERKGQKVMVNKRTEERIGQKGKGRC